MMTGIHEKRVLLYLKTRLHSYRAVSGEIEVSHNPA